MAQVSMTVRMDSRLKQMFDALCSEFGMSANTAMNIFAKAVVKTRSIPFVIKADDNETYMKGIEAFKSLRAQAEASKMPELSLDEINEEIKRVRKDKKNQQ